MTQSDYVKRVLDRLHLPRTARKRVEGDLNSDITAALEHGETWEEIQARMGPPEQVAAELSAQFETPGSPQEGYRALRFLSLLFFVLAALTLGRALLTATPWAEGVLNAAFYVAVGLCGLLYSRDRRKGLGREKSRRRLGGRIAVSAAVMGVGWAASALFGQTVTSSVALIGGVDGPTAYFTTAQVRPAWLHVALFAALAIAGLVVSLYRRQRKREQDSL